MHSNIDTHSHTRAHKHKHTHTHTHTHVRARPDTHDRRAAHASAPAPALARTGEGDESAAKEGAKGEGVAPRSLKVASETRYTKCATIVSNACAGTSTCTHTSNPSSTRNACNARGHARTIANGRNSTVVQEDDSLHLHRVFNASDEETAVSIHL